MGESACKTWVPRSFGRREQHRPVGPVQWLSHCCTFPLPGLSLPGVSKGISMGKSAELKLPYVRTGFVLTLTLFHVLSSSSLFLIFFCELQSLRGGRDCSDHLAQALYLTEEKVEAQAETAIKRDGPGMETGTRNEPLWSNRCPSASACQKPPGQTGHWGAQRGVIKELK